MKNVEGKVIVITGASSGIGEATARVLAENGAKVVLSARREERLQRLASELGQENVAYLKSDVTSLQDMQALVALAQERFGRVDAAFANAGTTLVPGNAVYCGTKHFVRAMLNSFHTESIQEGTHIRTTLIYPGAIKTELLDSVHEGQAKDAVSRFYENVGLEPEAIANAVLYAVSQPDNVDVTNLAVQPTMEN